MQIKDSDQELSFETVSGYLATMTDILCGVPQRGNPFVMGTIENRNWDYGREIALRPYSKASANTPEI